MNGGDIGEISCVSIHFHLPRATEKPGQEFQTSGPPASHSTSWFSLAWARTSEGFDCFSYASCLAVRVEHSWLSPWSYCSDMETPLTHNLCVFPMLKDYGAHSLLCIGRSLQKNKKIRETEAVLKLSPISKMLSRQAGGLELDPNNPCKRPGMC